MKDKVNTRRASRMAGHGPHKLFKMEVKKYTDKKEKEIQMRERPYGWMPVPEKMICPKCGKEMEYIDSDTDDVDWGSIKCVCEHTHECDTCKISLQQHIPEEKK